jgi:uncharacterized protein YjbI with pentapeptide repeats
MMTRRLVLVVAIALFGAAVASACGDDSSGGGAEGDGKTVNGCKIEPNTDCQGVDLSAQDLEDVDLTGANLRGANLARADLRNADLENADLERANLDGADLSDSDLTEANLMRISGQGTNFSGANLTKATFEGANLRNINVAGATNCMTVRDDGSVNNENCTGSGNSSNTPSTSTPPTTGGGGSTTTTTAPRPPANAPVVTGFNVPGVYTCAPGQQAATIAVSWTTQNAQSVNWYIDGSATSQDPGTGPNGSGNLGPLACNGSPHTVSIDAVGNGQTATKSATVNPG